MRLLIGVIIMVVIVSILAVYGNQTVESYAREIFELLAEVEIEVKEENWQLAADNQKELEEKWQRAQRILPVLLDHAELHDLEIALARINNYLAQQEKSRLLNEIAVAKRLARHMPAQERLSIRNIF